jgi:dTDP-4-dehydrorhamnose 3,5-epimerase
MKIINTGFKDLKIIAHKRHSDFRGSLRETYNKKIINWDKFIFEYATISKKNVLRGFHFQHKHQQSKLVTVIKGEILDWVIDLRRKSRTFGNTYSIILSENNCKSLYIPKGFAHAYFSIQKMNIIYYKLSDYYEPKFEDGICYNDTDLNVKWPKTKLIVSKKDKLLGSFQNFKIKYKGL